MYISRALVQSRSILSTLQGLLLYIDTITMVLLISLAFTALLCVTNVAADHHGNYAYVRQDLTQTPFSCVPFPKTVLCPNLNITAVVSEALGIYVGLLMQVNSSLHLFPGENASCIEAVIKQQCLGIPHCVGDVQGQTVDSDAALAECRRGRSLCSTTINNVFLDCDAKAEQYKNQTVAFPKASCALIQDPTGFCPDVQYERYNSSLLEYEDIFKQMKLAIEPLKGNVTSECYKKVKALACSNLGACSDDGKYLLALFNQKDCNNTLDCIPESDRYPIKSHLCSDAPDTDNPKVQKVPYPTGYEPSTQTPSTAPGNVSPKTTGNLTSKTTTGKPTSKTTNKAPSLNDSTLQLIVAVFSTYIAKLLVH